MADNRLDFRPVFPGPSGPMGIPLLDPDMLATEPPRKTAVQRAERGELVVCRTVSRGDFRGCTLATYCDDYRFRGCWTHPDTFVRGMLDRGYTQACTPDFSLYTDAPLIEQIWSVYRAAWVARYWQWHGLQVVPSLTWSDERSFGFAWCHIPRRPPLAIVDARPRAVATEGYRRCLAAALDDVRPERLIAYGSGEIAAPCPILRLAAWAPHRRIASAD